MLTKMYANISVVPFGGYFHGRNQKTEQKNNAIVVSKNSDALSTPNAFYNKQLLGVKKQSSGVNFSGFHLTEVPGFHCPCCDKVMYTTEEIARLAEKLSKAKGGEIEKILAPHVEQLHDVGSKVAAYLIKKSADNPKLGIKELLMFQRPASESFLINEQMKVLNPAVGMARALRGPTKHNVINSLNQIKDIVVHGKDNERFKRKKVVKTITHYTLVEKSSVNQRILENMLKKIEELPTSDDSFHAFVTKYTNERPKRSSYEIAEKIFLPSKATREHVDPAWRNTDDAVKGPTSTDNSLDMCSKCNGERETTPYYEFVTTKHPEMRENLPKHMDEVQHYIRKKDLNSYYSYPLKLRERIRRQSTPPGETKPLLDYKTDLIEEFIERKTMELQRLSAKYKSDPINHPKGS